MFARRKKWVSPLCIIVLSMSLLIISFFTGCVSRVDFFGTLSTVDMVIKHGTECITNGTGSCDFGSVDLFNQEPAYFTIENTGYMPLEITGVSIIWGDFSEYSIDVSVMSSIVQPGSSATFSVIFKPTTVGDKTARVGVVSNSTEDPRYIFSVYGYGNLTVTEPNITVKQGANDLVDGSGLLDCGNIGVGSPSSPFTVTISNNGDADLSVSDISFVSGDSDQFSIIAPSIPCNLAPAESTAFTVTFSPLSFGDKQAEVQIMNDDPDESPYTFSVKGYGEPIPEPEIHVKQGSDDIPDMSGYYYFGSIWEGNTSAPVTFTIENNGTTDLCISDIQSNSGEFTINASSMPFTISTGNSDTFTVTFSPVSVGLKSATVTIDNDDNDEDPYTFTVEGDGVVQPEPDINVKDDFADLPDGTGLYDFGHILIMNSSSPVIFSVENTGTGDLAINSLALSSGDTDQFTIVTLPSSPVAPGSSTTFEITFSPTSIGYKSAVVSIDNNDPDENPYVFTIEGYGDATAVPDIKLLEVALGGTYDFGNKKLGDSASKDFKIENKGTGDLMITSVSLTTGDTSQFQIDITSMSSIIGPGDNTKFAVVFLPTNTGNLSAEVTIDNNDPDENPYTFTVEGLGETAPIADINVLQGMTGYPDGSTYNFGQVSGSITRTYTIENVGTESLEITNILLMDGDPDYTLDLSSTTFTISPGGSTTFDITFNPQGGGIRWKNLVINSNDPDETPYNIRLEGDLND